VRRLARALAALVLVAVAAALAAAGGSGTGQGPTYRIVFDNAFGLTTGGDFRVAAVRAGQTTDFTVRPSRTGPPKAVVEAKVTESGVPDFRTDARCSIKPQSLVGEYYVDCQPGSSPQRLREGGTIPVEQTESTIAPDLVNDILRQPQRERLRLLVAGLGTGLAGRAEDFREVLRRAHPGLRETQKLLATLGRENATIERFLADADRVVGALARDRGEVTRFVTESGRTGRCRPAPG
jgi:ABC-type transporter Mla subunit MlaD